MIDRPYFYSRARDLLFDGSLSRHQVWGLEAMLVGAEAAHLLRSATAYVLATAYHETGQACWPIEEVGKGKGRPYGIPIKGHVYYGRGFVQLTWLRNYKAAGEELGIDLVHHPARALDLQVATDVLVRGMREGWFTGRKLAHYIGPTRADFVNARRIVNGLDCAKRIAGYAGQFVRCLQESEDGDAPAVG